MVERMDEPLNTEGMTYLQGKLDSIFVGSWGPNPDGKLPQTQVHLKLEIEGVEELPIVLRFKSPRTLDRVIGALLDHRYQVWPEADAEKENVRWGR